MINLNKRDLQYGPLQIVHDFKFTALNVKDDYSFVDRLSIEEKIAYFKTRLDRLYSIGYGGVVMNLDYRNYLRDNEAYLVFTSVAEYARSIGLRVWIYDEQYYPSGSAGGLVLKGHPELEALCLSCIMQDITVTENDGAIRIPSPCGYSELKYAFIAPILDGKVIHSKRQDVSDCRDLGGGFCYNACNGEWRVYAFFLRPLYEQTKFAYGTRATRRYINIFNRQAVEAFYNVTFEQGYKAHIGNGKELAELIDAVFTDEPYSPFYTPSEIIPTRTFFPSVSIYDTPRTEVGIYPYVPWEMTLPERFEQKYEQNIKTILPDIFDETDATARARIDFYSMLSEMSLEAFPIYLDKKLQDDGMALSGHYYGEEGFDYQPSFYGDILEHLSSMTIPGCDSLWSDINLIRYSTSCKLASSAAHMVGKNEVMIEASNMCDPDQNITIERMKAAISTMFIHGVTTVTSYYGENLLSEPEMREICEHVSGLASLFKNSRYHVNTYLYYPYENLCADRAPQGITEGSDNGEDHLGIGQTSARLMKQQVAFDFINKRALLSSKIFDGYLLSLNDERIQCIVLPNLSWVDYEVAEFLKKANERGVKVLFDTESNAIGNIDFAVERITEHNCPSLLHLDTYDPYIIAMQRDFDCYSLIMLVNTDEFSSHDLEVNLGNRAGEELYTVDLKTIEIASRIELTDRGTVRLSVPALETVIIAIEKNN